MKRDGVQYIEMLTADGTVLSSNPIVIPEGLPRFIVVNPVFFPGSDKLFFGYGGLLYTLTEHGEVSRVETSVEQRFGSPIFHPDGKRMLAIKGKYDGDVATLSLPGNDKDAQLNVFERSIEGERAAKFQPGAEAIAFVSRRTGEPQVWLTGEGGTRMISQLPKGTNLSDIHWDAKGSSLLVLSERELLQITPGGHIKTFAFGHPIQQLYHWDSEN